MNERDVTVKEIRQKEWNYKSVDSIPDDSDRMLMESAIKILDQSENPKMRVSAGLEGNGHTALGVNTESLHAEVNTLYDYFAKCIADGIEPDVQKIVVCAGSDAQSDPDVCGKCLSMISRFVSHQKTSPEAIQVLVKKRDGTVYQRSFASLYPKPFSPLSVEVDEINKRVIEILQTRGSVTNPLDLPPHTKAALYALSVRLNK